MIYVVGLGPGNEKEITPRAIEALEKSEIIIGYKSYIDLIAHLFPHKELVRSSMREETARCRQALAFSLEGKNVAVVSSGDAGIYGMGGLMLEIADGKTPVEVIPGITSACSSAAILGAPLMHDFCVISLSDILTPWDVIEKRLALACSADFVICIYNPASNSRPDNFTKACEIILQGKDKDTPAGWVRNAGRKDETHLITTLEKIKNEPLDMLCTVIIGNSATKILNGRMVTPRGYII